MEFQNYLVCDVSNEEMDFYVIDGPHSAASTISPKINNQFKTQKKKIQTLTIDQFCHERQVFPTCIKMDIEGSEGLAIRGMKKILNSCHPDIILETHSLYYIPDITLKDIINQFENYNYKFFDLMEASKINGNEFLKKYAYDKTNVLASIHLDDYEKKGILSQLKNQILKHSKETKQKIKFYKLNQDLKALTDQGKYLELIKKYGKISLDHPDMTAHYYLGFAYHATSLDFKKALQRYDTALMLGFDPFWIYYNRGSLYFKLNQLEKAYSDLKKAKKLRPEHNGLNTLLNNFKNIKNKN